MQEQVKNQSLLVRLQWEISYVSARNLVCLLDYIENQQRHTLISLREDLRRYTRLCVLAAWLEREEDRGKLRRFRRRNVNQDIYLDAYISLLILEERIAGRQEAFEGIRIVRERVPEK